MVTWGHPGVAVPRTAGHWGAQLPAEHLHRRFEPRGFLDSNPVGHEHQGQMLVPVSLVPVVGNCQLGEQVQFQVLHKTIALGMEQGGAGLVDL